jgi:phage recombination protein Bet
MSNVAKVNNSYDIDPHIWSTLKNSLYTGARDESILMVLDYCKAGNLDPLQKPVHIVPISVKNTQTGKYEFKDTIMAGIGLYRIQAARSNQYAGVSEPEYGALITANLGGINFTYPEWCKVTVRKIVHGSIVEFSAKEYWIENYATSGRDSLAPNTMWKKRPYGQIAKCAEAQALRKAFPEIVSQQTTAEEMEGKSLNEFDSDLKNVTPKAKTLSAKLDDLITEQSNNNNDGNLANIGQDNQPILDELSKLILTHNIPDDTITKWCNKAGVATINELDSSKIQSCVDHIYSNYVQEKTNDLYKEL